MGAGRPFTGSLDFMELFTPDASWQNAAEHVQVFKLFGEWIANSASDAELRQVFADLRRRGIAADVDEGPLTAPVDCGGGVEGFAGISEGMRIAQRVKAGRYDSADRHGRAICRCQRLQWCKCLPLVCGKGGTGCGRVRAGDAPAIPRCNHRNERTILEGYEGARPRKLHRGLSPGKRILLPLLHLDLDYSIADWPQVAKDLEAFCRARGIDFGIYYVGNWDDTSDEAWLAQAGERVKTYELQYQGRPDHVIFQSWNDHPDYSLPETAPNTYANFVDQYVQDKSALGVRTSGPGADLAIGKRVTASNVLIGFEPARAVDGNPETWWGAGAPPAQWIEIDLGTPSAIAGIRLRVSQSPAGPTDHRILVKGPDTGEQFVLVHEFKGVTTDLDELTYAACCAAHRRSICAR